MNDYIGVNNGEFCCICKFHILRDVFLHFFADFIQQLDVKTGIPIGSQKGNYQGFNCRMRSSICIRCYTSINNINSCFNCFKQSQISHSRSEMSVQMHRNFHIFLQCFYKIISIIRGNQASHIFNANCISTKLFQLFGFSNIIINIINFPTHSLFS